MDMGGLRILINPVLSADSAIPPEKVHEMADFVVVTSGMKPFFDVETIDRMKLSSVDFVAADGAGEQLSGMMVKNLAVLASGPGGRTLLESGRDDAVNVAVLVCPSSSALPWQKPELGFIFVNMDTGIAVGYEAQGLYLGVNAATTREGIPEEAYQVDHIITPDLREAAGIAKGLTRKGAILRSIVRLPKGGSEQERDPGNNPLLMLDSALDKALGAIEDSVPQLRGFLDKEGSPLSKTRILEPSIGGDAVNLE